MGAISAYELGGFGYRWTRGSGIPEQVQAIEQVPEWASGLPAQSIAEGFRYAFPTTESAFIDRSVRIQGGHGGYYTGETARAADWAAQWAAANPQLQFQHAQPWTNPWTAQQFWGGSSYGLPIWGGGYTPAFQTARGAPMGTGGAQPPVAVNGQWLPPGSTIERF